MGLLLQLVLFFFGKKHSGCSSGQKRLLFKLPHCIDHPAMMMMTILHCINLENSQLSLISSKFSNGVNSASRRAREEVKKMKYIIFVIFAPQTKMLSSFLLHTSQKCINLHIAPKQRKSRNNSIHYEFVM